jgi:hypothetical protein
LHGIAVVEPVAAERRLDMATREINGVFLLVPVPTRSDAAHDAVLSNHTGLVFVG